MRSRRSARPMPPSTLAPAPKPAQRLSSADCSLRRRRTRPRTRSGAGRRRRSSLPTYAINAVMLPTGKVAFWGRPPLIGGKRENRSEFWLWDPATGGLTRHDAPPIDLDGDGVPETPGAAVLLRPVAARRRPAVRGRRQPRQPGLIGAAPRRSWRGLDRAYTFDPWSLTWRSSRARGTGAGIRRRSSSPTGGSRSWPASTRPARAARTSRWRSSRPRPSAAASGTHDLPPGRQPRHGVLSAPVHAAGREGVPGRAGPQRLGDARSGGCWTSSLPGQRMDDASAPHERTTASAATRSCGRRARPATRA